MIMGCCAEPPKNTASLKLGWIAWNSDPRYSLIAATWWLALEQIILFHETFLRFNDKLRSTSPRLKSFIKLKDISLADGTITKKAMVSWLEMFQFPSSLTLLTVVWCRGILNPISNKYLPAFFSLVRARSCGKQQRLQCWNVADSPYSAEKFGFSSMKQLSRQFQKTKDRADIFVHHNVWLWTLS